MNNSEKDTIKDILEECAEDECELSIAVYLIEKTFQKIYERWKTEELQSNPDTRAETILTEIANKHGITVQKLRGPTRSQYLVDAREDACIKLHSAGFSYTEIGQVINRHMTTVIYTLEKYQNKIEE